MRHQFLVLSVLTCISAGNTKAFGKLVFELCHGLRQHAKKAVQKEAVPKMSGLTVGSLLLCCNVWNGVQAEPAHKEAVRGIAFSPSDLKFATCSDDSTIKAGFLSTWIAWHDCPDHLVALCKGITIPDGHHPISLPEYCIGALRTACTNTTGVSVWVLSGSTISLYMHRRCGIFPAAEQSVT